VDPVPDPLLLRKSGSAGDRTRDLCICSQKLWPLDHRGGLAICTLLLICSKRQLDDDSITSKHVAVRILYIVVLDGCLFVSYFVVQHNGMHNFKTWIFMPYFVVVADTVLTSCRFLPISTAACTSREFVDIIIIIKLLLLLSSSSSSPVSQASKQLRYRFHHSNYTCYH